LNTRNTLFRIVLFLAGSVVLIYFGIRFLSGSFDPFVRNSMIIEFPDVEGLAEGDPVLFKGIKAGYVKSVVFSGKSYGSIIVVANMNKSVPLSSNAEAFMASNSYGYKKLIFIDDPGGDIPWNTKDTMTGYSENMVLGFRTVRNVSGHEDSLLVSLDRMMKISDTLSKLLEKSGMNGYDNNIVFGIQICALSEKADPGTFNPDQRSEIHYYYHEGSYKYFLGFYHSPEEAQMDKNRLQQTGFPDAFLIAFKDNRRISVQEAVEVLEK